MSPEEHDEALLQLEATLRLAKKALHASERSVRVTAGQKRRGGSWQLPDGSKATFKQALEAAPPEAVQRYQTIHETVLEAGGQITIHEAAYSGWPRFRLVISSDGHVHGDAQCRSFRPTTETVVIPALSGKTAEDAVNLLGNACCSVCMPKVHGVHTKVSASLVSILVRRGTKAFEAALQRRRKPEGVTP